MFFGLTCEKIQIVFFPHRFSNSYFSKPIGLISSVNVSIEVISVKSGWFMKMVSFMFIQFFMRHVDGNYRSGTAPLVEFLFSVSKWVNWILPALVHQCRSPVWITNPCCPFLAGDGSVIVHCWPWKIFGKKLFNLQIDMFRWKKISIEGSYVIFARSRKGEVEGVNGWKSFNRQLNM